MRSGREGMGSARGAQVSARQRSSGGSSQKMEYQKALEGLFGVKQINTTNTVITTQSQPKKNKYMALKMLDNLVRTKIRGYLMDIQDFSNLQEG